MNLFLLAHCGIKGFQSIMVLLDPWLVAVLALGGGGGGRAAFFLGSTAGCETTWSTFLADKAFGLLGFMGFNSVALKLPGEDAAVLAMLGDMERGVEGCELEGTKGAAENAKLWWLFLDGPEFLDGGGGGGVESCFSWGRLFVPVTLLLLSKPALSATAFLLIGGGGTLLGSVFTVRGWGVREGNFGGEALSSKRFISERVSEVKFELFEVTEELSLLSISIKLWSER